MSALPTMGREITMEGIAMGFDVSGVLMIIAFLALLYRRLHFRIFWVSAVARIVSVPELPARGSFIGARIWVDLTYFVGPDSMRAHCKIPVGDSEAPWHDSVGMTVPIYYCASNPMKVVYIGCMWLWFEKMIFTRGWEVEMLLAGAIATIILLSIR